MSRLFSVRRPAVTPQLAAGLALILVLGCQSQPDATSPELAQLKLPRTLTVTGGGSGGGTVTAPA